jgi:O-methyltransferase
MKKKLIYLLNKTRYHLLTEYTLDYSRLIRNYFKLNKLYNKYSLYTMVAKRDFLDNMELVKKHSCIPGSVVECGVWRGGVSASLAEVLGNSRKYYLFDSFEGLPQAKEIDGESAINWQKEKDVANYYDNCSAGVEWAQKAMDLSGAQQVEIVKGWFKDTLPHFNKKETIAILRLDGDWYDSTMDCLTNLYPQVAIGGVILIDDYVAWDGCSRAVHDYLSKNNLTCRIKQFNNGNLHYIIKT